MSTRVVLGNRGIITDSNEITAGQAGGMRQATNVMIIRDNLAESRPGFGLASEEAGYTWAGPSTSYNPVYIVPYPINSSTARSLIFARSNSTTWDVEWSDNTVVSSGFSSTYVPLDETVDFYRTVFARGSSYTTSTRGIRKLTAFGDTAAEGGMIGPTGVYGQTSATTPTWLTTNYSVAYRVVFKKTDANNYVIRSGPSPWRKVANNSGGTRSISLEVPISSTRQAAGDIIEVYRSIAVTPYTSTPSDELYLAVEYTITSSDVSAGVAAISDVTAEADLGASLYTNASQQGILKANDVPPASSDINNYQNCTWYSNTASRYYLQSRISSFNSAGTGGWGCYTAYTLTTTSGSPTATVSSATGLAIGMYIWDDTFNPNTAGPNIPANTTITNIVGTTLTLSNNATANSVGAPVIFGDYITIDGTIYVASEDNDTSGTRKLFIGATSSVNDCIDNLSRAVALVNGNVVLESLSSDISSAQPGSFIIRSTEPNDSFVVSVASARTTNFSPTLSGAAASAVVDRYYNAVYYSKPDEPEAVPLVNYLFIGNSGKKILRIVPTEDCLLVFKEDGIYKINGDAPDGWTVTPVDPNQILVNARAVTQLYNTVFAWTNQGIVAVSSDGNVVNVSNGTIGSLIRNIYKYNSALNDPSQNVGLFAVNMDAENLVCFALPALGDVRLYPSSAGQSSYEDPTGTPAPGWWVYATGTGAWTYWDMRTTGASAAAYDKDFKGLIWARKDMNEMRAQRNNSSTQYVGDVAYSVTISNVAGTAITIAGGTNYRPQVGDVIDRSGSLFVITDVSSGTTFTVDRAGMSSGGAATAYEAVRIQLEWMCQTANFPNQDAHWMDASVQCQMLSQQDTAWIVWGYSNEHTPSTVNAYMTTGRLYDAAALNRIRTIRSLPSRNTARGTKFQLYFAASYTYLYAAIHGCAMTFDDVSERVNPRSDRSG